MYLSNELVDDVLCMNKDEISPNSGNVGQLHEELENVFKKYPDEKDDHFLNELR